MHGDRAMVIVEPEQWSPEKLTARLVAQNVIVNSIEKVEPSLEDVFTLLAHSNH